MIRRKTVPYAGSSLLLSGSTFSDIQKFLLNKYAAKELSEVIGSENLSFSSSWINIGNQDQLTPLTNQSGQGRLIIILNGSSYIISVSKSHSDPVIFRLSSGTSEAVWIPGDFFQAFLFQSPNTVSLTLATEARNSSMQILDTRDQRYKIDLNVWAIDHSRGKCSTFPEKGDTVHLRGDTIHDRGLASLVEIESGPSYIRKLCDAVE